MVLKWKLAFQLLWYRILMQIGLKGEEIYYIGGSEALPPPDPGRGRTSVDPIAQRGCGGSSHVD